MSPANRSWLIIALQLMAAGCDDPAPIVLGRLQVTIDAGGGDAMASEHDGREHEREPHDRQDQRAGASRAERN